MKRPHVRKTLAPSPRLTLWVPVLSASGLCGLWLAALTLVGRL